MATAYFSYTSVDLGLAAITALATWVSAHTGAPGNTGANEVTGGSYARVQTTWAAPVNGSVFGSTVSISIPAGNTILGWGVWDSPLAPGGNYGAGYLLPVSGGYFATDGVVQITPVLTGMG